MKLSIEQAATRLGMSRRQIMYRIRQGSLPAEKVAGRWFIDSEDLPSDEQYRHRQERKQQRMKAAVEDTLGVADRDMKPRYSVRDLKAFQIAFPLYGQIRQEVGEQHPASLALYQVLALLCQGCHRFEREEKAESYRAARDQVSLAICELAVLATPPTDAWVRELEQELMAALAGLMRHVDRPRKAKGK